MIVTTDGYILTNNHVVEDADKIEVTVGNGETKTYTAKVIGTDPMTDVAVLKIEATGLPAATIGDSAKLRVGDIVLAAGNPMELSQTVTQGIVSAMGRTSMGIVHQGRLVLEGELARLKAEVGDCPATEPVAPVTAMQGAFTWTCAKGRIEGVLLLAPTPSPALQALNFRVVTP